MKFNLWIMSHTNLTKPLILLCADSSLWVYCNTYIASKVVTVLKEIWGFLYFQGHGTIRHQGAKYIRALLRYSTVAFRMCREKNIAKPPYFNNQQVIRFLLPLSEDAKQTSHMLRLLRYGFENAEPTLPDILTKPRLIDRSQCKIET